MTFDPETERRFQAMRDAISEACEDEERRIAAGEVIFYFPTDWVRPKLPTFADCCRSKAKTTERAKQKS